MIVISIAVAAVAITFVVLAIFAIPAIIEARKAAIAAREFLARTETELQPVLKDLREVLADLRTLSTQASERAGEVRQCMEAIGDTGRYLRTINTVVGTVAGAVSTSSLWITGAKVAGQVIMDRVSKKRRQ